MEVQDHLPLVELERLERVESSAQRAKRLRIVILAVQGFTAVAMCVGLSCRICQRWVRRYNAEGLAGLDDLRGPQSVAVLTAEQEAQVRQRLEAGPLPEDRVCSLRGVDVQRILAKEFGVLRSLPAVSWLLHAGAIRISVPTTPPPRQSGIASRISV